MTTLRLLAIPLAAFLLIPSLARPARAGVPSKVAAKMRPNTDKDGRKFAYFKIMGIRPEAEAKALPGDEVPSGFGVNNVVIYYKNQGKRMWTSTANSIYDVKYDPNTKHYSGLDEKERRISTTKTKTSGSKRKIRLGDGVNFDEPVTMEICLQTKFDNCFIKELTVKIEGNDEDGYTVPGEIWLEDYVRQGSVHGPALPYTRKEEMAKQQAEKEAVIAANRAKYAPKTEPAAAAPAAAPPATAPAPAANRQPAKEVSLSDLSSAWKKLKTNKNPQMANFAAVEMFVKGFSPSLASRLSEDPAKVKKGKFKVKVMLKNEGEDRWANRQNKTVKGAYDEGSKTFGDFDLRFEKTETMHMSFDKPVRVRLEVESKNDGVYWMETTRTKESLGDPLVIDQYSPG